MRIWLYTLVAVFTMFILSCASVEEKPVTPAVLIPEVNSVKINGVNVNKIDNNRWKVVVLSSQVPNVSVYYSKNPYKVTALFRNSIIEKPIEQKYQEGIISNVVSSGGSDGLSIDISLSEDSVYSYSLNGSSLEILINKIDKDAPVVEKIEKVPTLSEKLLKTVKSDLKQASKITSINNKSILDKIDFSVGLDGISRYNYGYINNKLFYLDIFDVVNPIKYKIAVGKGVLKDIKLSQFTGPQKVRILFSLNKNVSLYVSTEKSVINISINMPESLSESYISSVDVLDTENPNTQNIVIKTIGDVNFEKKIVDGNFVLDFGNSTKLLQSVNEYTVFKGKNFRDIKFGDFENRLHMILNPNGNVFSKLERYSEGIMLTVSKDNLSAGKQESKPAILAENGLVNLNLKDMSCRDAVNLMYFGGDKKFVLDKDIKDDSNKDKQSSQGRITLSLTNVKPEDALSMILKTCELVTVKEGDIYWIVPADKYVKIAGGKASLLKEATQIESIPVKNVKIESIKDIIGGFYANQKFKSDSGFINFDETTNKIVIQDNEMIIGKVKELLTKLDVDPLSTEVFTLNYISLKDFKKEQLTKFLTKNSTVTVDEANNKLIISDTARSLDKIRELLNIMDIPPQKVVIEARIVEVNSSNSLDLGVQWGGQVSNKTTAYDFPGTIAVSGNTGTSGASGSGYAVNLPVGSPAGALSLALGSITGKYNIDLAISALEIQNKAKTISNPRITALDNKEAEIFSGGEVILISSGDNTKPYTVPVGLVLKVKPHITSDGMIFMDIEVEKTTLGTVVSGTAEKKGSKAKAQALVSSGETTVIGGIHEVENSEVTTSVPMFGKIPLLGWLFKNQSEKESKKELLVFITPKIDCGKSSPFYCK